MKLKKLLESTPGYKNRKFGDPLPTLNSVAAAHAAKQGVNEGSSTINNIQFDDSFFDADHEWMVKNKIKLAQIINRAIADSGIIQNASEQNKTVTLSLT